ncbi:T-complex-associated testis-expressed protein 1 [Nowakowskiella sp. JEL0407]|nr:T-complex-associated testis-expressed protein 1 [Nowakowskiella sp. JEL0407]
MKPTQPKDLEKVKNTDPYPDHVDLFLVVCYLVNLRELDVYYGVRDIGINFQWSFFGMTLNDCIVLSASLKNHSFTTPELLASYAELSKRSTQDQPDQYQSELTNSLNPRKNHEKNDGVKNVAVGVEKKMVGMGNSVACLRKLSVKMSLIDDEKYLSHNKISDKGARGIAKVLSSPKTQLSFVNLSNNLISEVGLTAIGKSLSLPPPHKQPQSQQPSQQSPDPQPPHPNQTLKTLLLRMNKITDQAATNFFTSLLQNSTLQILDFSCNGLTFACVDSVCKVLKVSKSLVKLDLSCNKLGSCPSGNINTGTNNFGGVSGLSSSDKSGAAANVSAAAVSGGAGGANVGADGLKDGKENDTSSNVPHGAETLVKPLVEISNNNKNLSLQNSVDDVTGRLLFDAVSQNKYITALDLRVCDISQEYMVAIQAAVNENAQIP